MGGRIVQHALFPLLSRHRRPPLRCGAGARV